MAIPFLGIPLDWPEAELNAFRQRLLEMQCPAGHVGLPQLSMPVAKFDGARTLPSDLG